MIRYQREFKAWRQDGGRVRETARNTEINRMIEQQANQPVERILVDHGYWIQATGVVNADRVQHALFAPSGIHLGNFWSKELAMAAALEHAETGMITR
jgi:hypothetical protein